MRGKSEEGVLERRCLNNGTQVCQEKVLLFLESLSKRYTEIQEKIEWISFLDVWFATPKSDHGGGGSRRPTKERRTPATRGTCSEGCPLHTASRVLYISFTSPFEKRSRIIPSRTSTYRRCLPVSDEKRSPSSSFRAPGGATCPEPSEDRSERLGFAGNAGGRLRRWGRYATYPT